MSERVRCTTPAHVATRRRASRGGLARLVQPRHLHSMSALVPTDLPHTLPRNRLGSSQPIYKRARPQLTHPLLVHPLFIPIPHPSAELFIHLHHTDKRERFIKHRREMKHPREEEVAVSLALSLSTTTDSSSPASSASSTGGAAAAPSSSSSAAKRRRRGPVVATSGEGDFVCKTCSRAFPTFQALGGHRTSHLRGRGHGLDLGVVGAKALKQHKAAATDKPASGQLMKHECHICGLGFEMGQALGGHMRRHREEMATDDWVWRTQERVVVAAAAAESPVLLELFA